MIRRLLATVLPLIALLGTGPSAGADAWRGSDPAGDVQGMVWDEDADPCEIIETDATDESDADVTGLRLEHRRHRVVVTVDLDDLRGGRSVESAVHLTMPGHVWTFWIARRAGHDATVFDVDFADQAPTTTCVTVGVTTLTPDDCRSITAGVSTSADRIRLRVPRSCLGEPRWVRAGAGVSVTRDDETYSFDRWGRDMTSWTGKLTPRVRVGR